MCSVVYVAQLGSNTLHFICLKQSCYFSKAIIFCWCSWFASSQVSGVETHFSDVMSVQEPTQEPLQTQTIASVRTRAELPLVSVPVVRRGVQTLLLVGLHQLIQVVHPHASYNQRKLFSTKTTNVFNLRRFLQH